MSNCKKSVRKSSHNHPEITRFLHAASDRMFESRSLVRATATVLEIGTTSRMLET